MRSANWFRLAAVLLLATLIGCAGGNKLPQDEARAKYSNEDYSTPEKWQAVAQKNYPPAYLDYFEKMDMTGKEISDEPSNLKLSSVDIKNRSGIRPLKLSPEEVKGRNAWVLWAGGNQAFWDWLARHGYGAVDFLKLIDSKDQKGRFARTGLITEPGIRPPTEEETKKSFGVRFARPITEDQDPNKIHVEYRKTAADGTAWHHPDYDVYGWPTGVVGLRWFENPEFTDEAKARWQRAHANDPERYYNDPSYAARADTIRPYRIGMSCGFCHIAHHPLNPPADPENPQWENLSNNIGNQYLRFRATFGSTLKPDNYLYHVLDAQLPGALDTSLIPSDNLNNPNTINSFYGLRGRIERAANNRVETLSPDTLAYFNKYERANGQDVPNPQFVPRVLLDGADSIGVATSLSRVYLNIGTYHQQWIRLHNPLLGYRTQEPFKLRDIAENSLYWHATLLRIDPLVAFFKVSTDPMRLKDAPLSDDQRAKHLRGTGLPWYTELPPKLEQKTEVPKQSELKKEDPKQPDPLDYHAGRAVFAKGCIACHSSIQPGDLPELEVKLNPSPMPTPDDPHGLLPALPPMPTDWAKLSNLEKKKFVAARQGLQLRMEDLARLTRGDGTLPPAYAQWARAAVELREFWQHKAKDGDKDVVIHNFMSTDIRIPVTLTHTNSARAMATNALHNHIWEDFSSETYKGLDSVGRITYHDPFSGADKSFEAPSGGPGYYRVPTLIGIWATAPFFHNNALGTFNNDPSVKGRLEAFDDAIHRLLWPDRRMAVTRQHVWDVGSDPKTGADNATPDQLANDGGWIYRTKSESWLMFEGHEIPTLIAGFTGLSSFWVNVLPWLPSILSFSIGIALLLSGQLISVRERLERIVPVLMWVFEPIRWILVVSSFLLAAGGSYLIWWEFWYLIELLDVATSRSIPWLGMQVSSVPVLLAALGVLFILHRLRALTFRRRLAQWTGAVCMVLAVMLALGFGRFLSGNGPNITFGPFPMGMPVNVLGNMSADPPGDTGRIARKALIDWVLAYHRAPDGGKPGLKEFEAKVAPALMNASKCPDLVTDRGHDYEFIRALSDKEKEDLILLLKTF